MKVYLAAFGSGMGHASRMSALAERLTATGDQVMFSSSGEVTDWLRNGGYACNDLPLVDIAFARSGAFSATETLKFFPAIMAHLVEQVHLEVGNLASFAPGVVLSDSVASTIAASRLLGVRSVALLNQLRLVSSPNTPAPIAEALSAASIVVGGLFWRLCDDILIPDLPPPYTISERNLWSAGKASARARYIGFLTPKRTAAPENDDVLRRWLAEKRRIRVFWQISGPPATRRPFVGRALRAAKALADDYLFVITAGNPRGVRSPHPVPGGYLYQWCDFAGAFIDSCAVVVSRAGHVSLSDYILRAKPSLLVPIQAQTEQMGNASKAQRLGISMAVEEQALEPGVVSEALQRLLSGEYSKRLDELKAVAERHDALGSIVQVLRGG
jgi:UDP-N-acetylglucosamine--N-acetylmuramyl-(pentapeptide) pyrophosphoryl-undecaprenol N-acetylglucosamine transferase